MNMSGFFGNSPWDGGGGTPVIVIDNLQSTSGTEALSANQGRELKRYIDELEERLTANIYLRKYELQVSPTIVGQTVFEIPFDRYNPQDFQELIFFNSTKVSSDFYTISPSNDSNRYVITFNSGVSTLSSIINIVLLTEEDDNGNISLGFEKREFVLRMSQQGQTTLEIPFDDYSPDLYVDLLFFNSTKVLPSTYSIVKIDESDENSRYQIVLNATPVNYQSAVFNLVLFTNGNARNGGSGNIPSNTVNKSSIIFGVRGRVDNGRFEEEFFPVPYDLRVTSVMATVVTPSTDNLILNIENTRNFTTYNSILPSNLTIAQGSNTASMEIGYDLFLSKGDNLFLSVKDYAQDASNLVVNLIIEKV